MRKIKEVLRLKFAVGLGLRAIARSCSIGLGTVHEYLQRAEAAGLTWPLGEDWDEDRRRLPCSVVRHGLAGGVGDARLRRLSSAAAASFTPTQQLLWEEYRQANPDGYRYSRFCELYQRWRSKLDVVLRQEHKAGEKMFVDWAGATIPVYDRTGVPASRRLCSWPRSAPVPTPGPKPRAISRWNWLRAHVHAFEFFRGFRRWRFPTTPRPA